ncbi:MAG: hypothetical protein KKD05_07255 [Candidatus Omnitrophica bacterium]|nr:hypothetical protein [Candidatus Omnitrophota bacterium]
MANPLSNEKEIYEYIKIKGSVVPQPAWDFMYRRVGDNVTAIILLCRHWLAKKEFMPVQEAKRIINWINDMKNVVSLITAPSKENSFFPQFDDFIPLDPIAQELINPYVGSDVVIMESAIEAVMLASANPAPVSPEITQKVLNHAQAMKEFMEKIKDLTRGKNPRENTAIYTIRLVTDCF